MRSREHPFASQWNHNTHYFPLLAARIPASADLVLDVGCGEGTFCRFIENSHRAVIGVDVDASVLPSGTGRATYARALAQALPFPDETFAAVTMTMVLHHVDAVQAMAEAVRVLTPSGTLLILGYARFGGWRDVPHELRDLITHRVISRRMQSWEPPTAKADPSDTWAEARRAARIALPQCSYQRLAMWRYLVEWHKPQPS